jgi:type II secretory pathway pseudopilin PulG
MDRANAGGFSLVETLVATMLVTITLSALAQLFVLSAHANSDARRTTRAIILAGEKLEQLQDGASSVSGSPGGSLVRNVSGFCDFLDEQGRPFGAGISAPAGTKYLRRWSIEGPLGRPPGTYVLQVVVRPAQRAAAGPMWGDSRSRDERKNGGAHLVAMRSTLERR